jgi:methylenetetrahydrofolate reductase (NADPH)
MLKSDSAAAALAALLGNYSAEVTSGDRKSIDAAKKMMPRGAEVYITSLPSQPLDRQIVVARELRAAGLIPIPHVVARNIRDRNELDLLLRRLTSEAGVDRALILAGDRESPAGDLTSSLQILQSGLLGRYGIRKIALSWYPEGHRRIAEPELIAARSAKLAFAAEHSLEAVLVSQFCFEATPIVDTAREMRAAGINVPLRVGVAGPASRAALLKYALICGVGASLRALRERPEARNLVAGETPEELLTVVAQAQAANPTLGIQGVHFFTFASLAETVRFVDAHVRAVENA